MGNEWSEDIKIRTYSILESVNMEAFCISWGGQTKGCQMKSLTDQYGYVTRDDALKKEWRIFHMDTDKLLGLFESIDDLIKSGWVVD